MRWAGTVLASASTKLATWGLYPVGYEWAVIEVRQTEAFAVWFDGLRDREARFRVVARIRRLSLGNIGDTRSVGGGVSELRIAHGPGVRLYFRRLGPDSVVLLTGGDKSTQRRDIRRAKALARGL
jgi:putative addiction module killer protein